MEWEKILANHISNEGLESKYERSTYNSMLKKKKRKKKKQKNLSNPD